MKTEADDDDGAVSVDFFFPVKFCFIPAGSVKFFPGFPEKEIMKSILQAWKFRLHNKDRPMMTSDF